MEILIKVSKMTCPMGRAIIEKTKENEAEEIPIFVMKNGSGRFEAFAEEVNPDNLIGFVLSVDGKADPEFLESAFAGKPEIRITGLDKPTILAAKMDKKDVAVAANSSESKELSDLWEQKIKEGIVTQEDREYITWHWDNNKVNEFDRKRAVKGYRIYKDAAGNRIKPVKPAHTFVNADPNHKETPYDGSVYAELFNAALNRQPIVCEGDKSTGKSVAAKNVAFDLQMPIYEDTYSEDMMKLDPIAERAFSEEAQSHMTSDLAEAYLLYKSDPEKYSQYFEDAREYMFWKDRAMTPQLATNLGEMGKWAMTGGVYIANEANLARINVRESIFNPAAEDNQPHLTIPGYGMVYLNPDCVLIATQNRDYAGTNGSNDAIDSRFGKIKFGYPPHIFDQLKAMTESDVSKGCLPDEYYRRCDNLYTFLRGQVHDGQRENGVLSIRSFGKALKDVALSGGYATLHSKLLVYLQSMTHTEEEDKAIADDIHQYVGTL